MSIKSLFIITLFVLSGIVYCTACPVPPDILNEFRLDTSGSRVKIHYTLMGWKNLHPKMLDEIQKNTGLKIVDKNLEAIARDFLLTGSSLTINKQPINLQYITGSIVEYNSSDPDYSYNPEPLIELEFATDIPYPWRGPTEVSLIFDKTHLYDVSPLIHAYIYSDIEKYGQSQSYVLGSDNRSYFPSSLSGHTYGFRNDLTETNTINTFVLYIEPMQDNKLLMDSVVSRPASSSSPLTGGVGRQSIWSVGGYLQQYIQGNGGIYLQIIGLIVAIFAGMIHGLLPGHAKSLIGTYMITTTRVGYRDILVLVGSVTFSHTIFIFILATIIITLEKGIGTMTAYVTMMSAICYIAFGVYFYLKGTRLLKHIDHKPSLFTIKELKSVDCDCSRGVSRSHGLRGSTLSGILAGANPCIDALALFIFAVNIGSAGYAFMIIVCFSLGLGLMLAILALLVTRSRVLLEKKSHQFAERISAHITILAGITIIVMGSYTLLH